MPQHRISTSDPIRLQLTSDKSHDSCEIALLDALGVLRERMKTHKQKKNETTSSAQGHISASNDYVHLNGNRDEWQILLEEKELEWKERTTRLKAYAEKIERHKQNRKDDSKIQMNKNLDETNEESIDKNESLDGKHDKEENQRTHCAVMVNEDTCDFSPELIHKDEYNNITSSSKNNEIHIVLHIEECLEKILIAILNRSRGFEIEFDKIFRVLDYLSQPAEILSNLDNDKGEMKDNIEKEERADTVAGNKWKDSSNETKEKLSNERNENLIITDDDASSKQLDSYLQSNSENEVTKEEIGGIMVGSNLQNSSSEMKEQPTNGMNESLSMIDGDVASKELDACLEDHVIDNYGEVISKGSNEENRSEVETLTDCDDIHMLGPEKIALVPGLDSKENLEQRNSENFTSDEQKSEANPEYLKYIMSDDGMVGIEALHDDMENEEHIYMEDDYYQLSSELQEFTSGAQYPDSMKDVSPACLDENKSRDSKNFTSQLFQEEDDYENSISKKNLSLLFKLYSHLLPPGITANHQIANVEDQDDIWVDTPEEEDLGYVVYPVMKSHLLQLESEFQKIVKSQLANLQNNLLEDTNVETDHNFEQDLQAAESLLEKDELTTDHEIFDGKLETADSSTYQSTMLCGIISPSRKSIANEGDIIKQEKASKSKDESTSGEDNIRKDQVNGTVEMEQESSNVQHIKKIGYGKQNELEQFPLPIIYNAFQTGFEPTKELLLEPGMLVAGQYLVESELGSAAFSTAYRCIDMAADPDDYHCEVCLKVIKNTKDFFDQSLDEIKILELLRQTGQCEKFNIVEMRSYFYYKEHLIIVTELLRQNLFEFGKFIIENEEVPYFTITRLCYITRQILVALDFVEKMGLVHSDVKPENILIASYSRARIKLIDFGSSCFITDRQSSYIQSRSYRAPEVILGLPYDAKIDIWSLGCVVAEMFTGQVTFQNRSVVTMLSRIEAICGPFPQHMIINGKHSSKFFTPGGLIYERVGREKEGPVSHDEDDDSIQYCGDSNRSSNGEEIDGPEWFKVYRPKQTTLSERLGFDKDLMEKPRGNEKDQDEVLFTDFVRSLLTIDPQSRPSASEALLHPWILSGINLTEADVRYAPDE